jgi:hypothetical protein
MILNRGEITVQYTGIMLNLSTLRTGGKKCQKSENSEFLQIGKQCVYVGKNVAEKVIFQKAGFHHRLKRLIFHHFKNISVHA